jgi:hypothetical protein
MDWESLLAQWQKKIVFSCCFVMVTLNSNKPNQNFQLFIWKHIVYEQMRHIILWRGKAWVAGEGKEKGWP